MTAPPLAAAEDPAAIRTSPPAAGDLPRRGGADLCNRVSSLDTHRAGLRQLGTKLLGQSSGPGRASTRRCRVGATAAKGASPAAMATAPPPAELSARAVQYWTSSFCAVAGFDCDGASVLSVTVTDPLTASRPVHGPWLCQLTSGATCNSATSSRASAGGHGQTTCL